ncbi:unnamed protein product, partial [Prorocentrum cordatum]
EQGQLAYWQIHAEAAWNRTVYFTEISREFVGARGLEANLPELVQYWWDEDFEEDTTPGGSLPVNIYACLYAGTADFFRSELFRSYFSELDSWMGWDEHCWSVQNVLAVAGAFFIRDVELTELVVFGRHQQSSKTPGEGWNDSRNGLLPARGERGARPPPAEKQGPE